MSTTRPPPPSPGDVLAGKYRVERVIGEGGMGVVVAATHVQLGQLVALKFTTIDGGAAAARFLREAQSAVRLKSEHVARVSDVGTLENGTPYMVMEYLEGSDLSEVLRVTGPLPVQEAVGYVIQACEAVAEAHSLGIVHRDLKPHNLFLTRSVSGQPKVKVLDFGISKTTDASMALTRTAEIVGTPSYMSPEQLRSAKDVDARSDLWALGVILYELLTGRLPFEADNLPQLCTMVATESPPPPIAYRPDLPAALSAAVLRCLARAPEARFQDAGELVAAIGPFAPDWSSAERVQLVARSAPSGRAVIAPSSGSGSGTGAAWSETELAPRTPGRARALVMIGAAALAIGGAMFIGVRMGASEPRAPVVPVATDSVPAAKAAPSTPAAAPPAATPTAPTAAPTQEPTPTPTTTTKEAPPASGTTRPARSAAGKAPRSKTPDGGAPAGQPDDSVWFQQR